MNSLRLVLAGLFVLAGSVLTPVQADLPGPPPHPFEYLFGKWAGPASGQSRDGHRFELTQTERVGPMLNGSLVVIEGRGYNDSGMLRFNAFAVISRNRKTAKWEIRSYARGNAGTFPLELRKNGFRWTIPAGPDAIMRYTATVKGGTWHEIGEYVPKEGVPTPVFEMTLKRIGDTDWPAGDPVTPPETP